MATFLNIPNTRMIFCGSIITLILGIIGFAVLISLNFVSTDSSVTSLEFVIAVPRHGARVPIFNFPTNPYQGTQYWPEGRGALTKKGKEQMYQIGQSLRKRYSHLFEEHGYRSEDLMVRSTPRVRTYMSVAVLLAGMFPPEGINVWHPTIAWQPIPIFTDYHLDKTKLVTSIDWCPKFANERIKLGNETMADYFKENRDFFNYVGEHSGIAISTAIDYVTVWDPIITSDIHGFSPPSWTDPIFPEKMNKIASEIYRLSVAGTTIMNKLFSGPLLTDLDGWISRKIAGNVSEKMLIHGAHDVTLTGLLSAVGFKEIPFVQPAATLIIELHTSALHEREVRMLYYNNSDTEEPVSLNMPKCQNPCSVSNFFDIIRLLEIEGEWEDACKM
ncbi:hypothetical protein LSTR_LSTR013898 [Laodelphax striatellus]|uniref:acid phosphatase n=1 Tax=Laodelphax striatellus TaxID=195883 RepID=A0A482X4B0_LAOST|nr:hypothetical protein LSTR_LSTR013898 [Laodelphax striatellus]